ncbi:MAG: DEAD/DEAH box helicase [Bradymonadaceae bacterium]|nr:DEAD/DEAH box helicase [Lujinxingiaceae bacterium]
MTTQHEIRELLHHSWYAFFGRFGNLRQVQIDAIPPIVAGKNVLVGAATASGKTEAVVGPLVERIMAARHEEAAIRLMVISPTRALCNDLYRRLEGPVGACRLSIDIKSGDSPGLNEAEPPAVLITTPESLDSMLARRPKVLRGVRAVMIDELHMLDNSARGDQLRVLLERLTRIVDGPLQVCAASATLPDAPHIAQRFMGPAAICVSPSTEQATQRKIDATLLPAARGGAVVEAVEALFAQAPGRKILVFTNARADVESIVALLGKRERLRGKVFAHHGSLSRELRLNAERSFLNAPAAICVATMTLELGVDIGSVDRVVLIGPPPNVSSLLQRVGRSNRKEDTTHLLCLYEGGFERLRLEHLLSCAVKSELFEDNVPFRPSVIAQQALSLVFQNPKNWIDAESVHARLGADVGQRWTLGHCKQILDRMCEQEYFHPAKHGRYVADDRAKKMFEYGLLHGNIEDSAEIEVFDETTGQLIGRAALSERDQDRVKQGLDVNLSLAGKSRQLLRIRDNQAFVDTTDGLDTSMFVARQAPRYSYGLARSLASYLDYGPDAMHQTPWSQKRHMLGHFFGTTWARLLEYVLVDLKLLARPCNAFFVTLKKPLPLGPQPFGTPAKIYAAIGRALPEDRASFARILGAGPFRSCLPDDILDEWIEDAVDTPAFVDALTRTQVHSAPVYPRDEPEEQP